MIITLTKGYTCEIDDEDWDLIRPWHWCVNLVGRKPYKKRPYAYRTDKPSGKKGIFMHRWIMNAQKGQTVDHEDHDGLNNKRANLRFLSKSKNAMHRANKTRGWTYSRMNKSKPYTAHIGINGKGINLGYFATQIEAETAYLKARQEYFATCDSN